VRLYRGDTLVWESQVVENTLRPELDVTLPRNVELSPRTSIRIELWDMDVTPHIIGVWRGQGLPATALPDADAHIRLDGGADVAFRIDRPLPHRGVGIKTYEQRGDHLRVIEVEPFSPAARAGVVAGDEIVAIGGQRVEELGDARAASAISLAAERNTPLTVRRGGREETVELDHGYVWLVM
jgi:membrane-associated protease RseP (regulator of RpoE activity)